MIPNLISEQSKALLSLIYDQSCQIAEQEKITGYLITDKKDKQNGEFEEILSDS